MTATTFNIHQFMSDLSKCNPIFHNESYLQHELAGLLYRKNYQVEKEHPFKLDGKSKRLDILLPKENLAIELKCCTQKLSKRYQSDFFELRNQGAQDQKRYAFLRDVRRLERLCEETDECEFGYSIFLTNDSSYWNPPWDPKQTKHTSDKNFRLSEGRLIEGKLCWEMGTSRGTKTSAGTMNNMEAPISLNGSYKAIWKSYSQVDENKHGTFKYLAFLVRKA